MLTGHGQPFFTVSGLQHLKAHIFERHADKPTNARGIFN